MVSLEALTLDHLVDVGLPLSRASDLLAWIRERANSGTAEYNWRTLTDRWLDPEDPI